MQKEVKIYYSYDGADPRIADNGSLPGDPRTTSRARLCTFLKANVMNTRKVSA